MNAALAIVLFSAATAQPMPVAPHHAPPPAPPPAVNSPATPQGLPQVRICKDGEEPVGCAKL